MNSNYEDFLVKWRSVNHDNSYQIFFWNSQKVHTRIFNYLQKAELNSKPEELCLVVTFMLEMPVLKTSLT